MRLAALRPTLDGKYLFALLRQQLHDRIHKGEYQEVLRSSGQHLVEAVVSRDKGVRITQMGIHGFDSLLQQSNIPVCCVRRRQCSNARLKNLTDFDQFSSAVRLGYTQHESQRISERLGGTINDNGSTAGSHLEQSF